MLYLRGRGVRWLGTMWVGFVFVFLAVAAPADNASARETLPTIANPGDHDDVGGYKDSDDAPELVRMGTREDSPEPRFIDTNKVNFGLIWFVSHRILLWWYR